MVILTLLHPQQRTPLKQWCFERESLIRIGRSPENQVVLSHPLVSRHHLELRRVALPAKHRPDPETMSWQMLNHSSNGTFVNGYLVSRTIVADNALLQLAEGGPILRVQMQISALPQPGEQVIPTQPIAPPPQLPILPGRQLPTPRSPTCTHGGNAAGNLFCVHCGQPITVEKSVRFYQVLRILGRGGMGTTYLAWDQRVLSPNGKPGQGGLRVLKEMNADIAAIPKAQELFEREASTLKTLNHPGIPQFYDFFVEQGKKYLVMELIHGQDLEKRVRQQGRVPLPQAIAWMIQTCEVLDYLHHRPVPIIHRDIKPGNLLARTLDNRMVMIDFGAVKEFGLPSSTRIGAEGYSAPEQTQGRAVIQSDLYAIAPTLIFLITGENPLRFYKKTNQGYRFTVANLEALPTRLRIVLERLAEPRASDRYQSAGELATILESCL